MKVKYYYTLEIRKIKKKHIVIRVWHKDWFPINPVIGVDYNQTR